MANQEGRTCGATKARDLKIVCIIAAVFIFFFAVTHYFKSEVILFDIPPSVIKEIVEFGMSVKTKGKTVSIALANDAYLPLANSWLCNTKFMGVHEQVMVIVPDNSTKHRLARIWPHLHVVSVPTKEGNISGPKDFTTVGFQRITYLRSLTIKELLVNDLDVFVFEFDAIWFRNPIDDFKEKLGEADIAVVEVTSNPDQVAVGIMYIRSTPKTKLVYIEMINRFDRLLRDTRHETDSKLVSTYLNDQLFLSDLVHRHFAGVKVVYLPVKIYADGHWYFEPADKRTPNPVIINNNWVIGISTKINRAKQYKHWFWDMENQKCMDDHVRNMTHRH